MKKLTIYIAALLCFASCSDQLNVTDPDSLSPELALSEISGFESVLGSAYNRIHAFGWMGQNGILAPEVLADNMDFANFTGRFELEYVNSVRAHMGRWGLYRGINDCNILLNKVDAIESVEPTDELVKTVLKGEGYFLRALHYHELAKVYGYEPGQEVNGFNLTAPIRTTPTDGVSDALNVNARATNTEMYAQIKSDLDNATTNLDGVENDFEPYRVGEAATAALYARVSLFEGSYAQAAAKADEAIDKTSAVLTTVDNHLESWSQTPHPESIFEVEIRAVDWSTVDGVNSSVASLTNNLESGSQYILVPSAELISAVDSEAGDIRSQLYEEESSLPAGSRKSNKWNGEQGDFRENIPVIRYAEMLLTAAEGYARSGNEALALERLNTLREARGLPASNDSGNALINLILKERRVELAVEGHRWFDLKRLGMNIPKSARSNQPTLSYSDFRILPDLPVSELNLNDLLVQNPGY